MWEVKRGRMGGGKRGRCPFNSKLNENRRECKEDEKGGGGGPVRKVRLLRD